MLELALYTLLGVLIGAASGLIPGLHTNTIAAVLLGAFYSYGLSPVPLSFLILGIAVAHAFVGFVPSIFLGAPNEGTVLSVAPGHRMLQKGRGYEALFLAVSGGIGGAVLLAVLFPVLVIVIPKAYGILRPSIQYVLLLAAALLIIKEKNKPWAALVFLLSGAFGIIALDSGINSTFVLLPVLSGLFGISTLCLSYFTESSIPPQSMRVKLDITRLIPDSLRGLLGGMIAGLLPGIGSSQSAIIASEFTRQKGVRGFMAMLGAIAVTDIVLSVLAISLVGNPRSGAAVAIHAIMGSEIDAGSATAFLGAGLLAAGVSASAALYLGVKFQGLVSRISYKKIIIAALLMLFAVIYTFTGALGLFVSVVGASIGAIPNFAGVKKSLLLGCLIVPTILYFFGIAVL